MKFPETFKINLLSSFISFQSAKAHDRCTPNDANSWALKNQISTFSLLERLYSNSSLGSLSPESQSSVAEMSSRLCHYHLPQIPHKIGHACYILPLGLWHAQQSWADASAILLGFQSHLRKLIFFSIYCYMFICLFCFI